MIARLNLIVSLLLLSVISSSFAAAPSGTLTYSFSTTNPPPVYDFEGDYPLTQQLRAADGQLVDVSFGVHVAQDERGRLSGGGFTIISVGNELLGGDYTVSGRVTGSSAVTRVRMLVTIRGEGVIAGVATRFLFRISYSAEIRAETQEWVGRTRGSASFSEFGRSTITSDLVQPLPPTATGSWDLTLGVFPLQHLGGSASAQFPTGRTIPMSLSGRYSLRRDESRISLRGIDAPGVSLRLVLDGSSSITSLRGRILGQRVRF